VPKNRNVKLRNLAVLSQLYGRVLSAEAGALGLESLWISLEVSLDFLQKGIFILSCSSALLLNSKNKVLVLVGDLASISVLKDLPAMLLCVRPIMG
jgi:hypothetical protein